MGQKSLLFLALFCQSPRGPLSNIQQPPPFATKKKAAFFLFYGNKATVNFPRLLFFLYTTRPSPILPSGEGAIKEPGKGNKLLLSYFFVREPGLFALWSGGLGGGGG